MNEPGRWVPLEAPEDVVEIVYITSSLVRRASAEKYYSLTTDSWAIKKTPLNNKNTGDERTGSVSAPLSAPRDL